MKNKQVLFLSAVGSALEYFDFVIYALAVSYISMHFFPKETPFFNILETLLIFATGYVFRPFGGMIFGIFGDRHGRKNSFSLSILLMGVATLTIGLLPTYEQIGMYSPVLLFLARATQGIAQGAELSGAFTFVYEHEQNTEQAPVSLSILTSGIGFGALLGSLVFAFLSFYLPDEDMIAYGWRLPFIFGGCVAFIGYVLRKNTLETPAFLRQQKTTQELKLTHFFVSYWRKLLANILMVIFPATLIINFLFLPNFLNTFYNYSPTAIFVLQTFGLFWSAILLPFTGKLAVFLCPKRQMSYALQSSFFFIPLAYGLLSYGSVLGLLGFVVIYQSIIALLASCYGVILTSSFAVDARYKGTAISYNVAFAIAGFMPYLLTRSSFYFESANIFPVILLVLCGMSYFYFRKL